MAETTPSPARATGNGAPGAGGGGPGVPGAAPPTPVPVPRAAWVQLAVCTAVAALLQMDGTIVTVALPEVGGALDVSAHTASWALTAYFAVYALGLLPGGRLVDRFGPRPIAVVGLALFCAGTLVGALAQNFALLVVSRVIQGAGAGLASPAALAGAVAGFPARRRGTALGVWGAASGLSNLVGPLLGGVLTEVWGWRANWWALLPMGLAALGAVLWKVGPAAGPAAASSPHAPAAPGVPAAAPDPVRAGSPTAAPGAASMSEAAAGTAAPAPAGSMRTVHTASAVAAVTFALMIGTFFAMEQYLQHAAGYGVLEAATAPMVLALCIGAFGPPAGRLTDRHGERRPALAGFAACALAFAVYAPFGVPLHGWALLPGGLLLGLGLGLLFPATSRAALNSVPAARHGDASARLSLGRLAGAACGAALAGLAFRGGVTTDQLRLALLGGGVLSVLGAVVVAVRFARPDS
ncbi:MFS transporter [Streptomyces sp. LX-29]|uniref:MFS transporter n=1 Tax=Streptomyces sp. LX-29 TaxID=2900152 RepID=UPI00240D87EB|nr:MFS transporter [Streptomyces sp. LX-29]WFB10803.1 MFS transporter [Streptomyces sp. LX-29]